MTVARTLGLFLLAAVAEIGGGLGGVLALAAYGFVATLQPDPRFGRLLAAYGGVFVVGSLAWGTVADGTRPDRFDLAGAAVCLLGVGVIMFAPRGA